VTASDLDTAEQFRSAAEGALRTGDFEALVELLAPDVECVTPVQSVNGVDALVAELGRARPTERIAIEFENGEWKSLSQGRFSCEIRALYRPKLTDEPTYSRDRSFELTIRDGKVSRFEMRFDD
jgi:SnoaL-like domain